MNGFTTLPASNSERVAELNANILDWRRLQWNASQAHDASGVFRCERALDALYAERDGIVDGIVAADAARRAAR